MMTRWEPGPADGGPWRRLRGAVVVVLVLALLIFAGGSWFYTR